MAWVDRGEESSCLLCYKRIHWVECEYFKNREVFTQYAAQGVDTEGPSRQHLQRLTKSASKNWQRHKKDFINRRVRRIASLRTAPAILHSLSQQIPLWRARQKQERKRPDSILIISINNSISSHTANQAIASCSRTRNKLFSILNAWVTVTNINSQILT